MSWAEPGHRGQPPHRLQGALGGVQDAHDLPLGAAEQTELLTRWVTDRAKVTAALERLSRTPRLRRLAENPLLLTLVGLLLRAGQDVPSRRGDLYERALKLLLTRDHNNEDAAPVAPMREPDLTLELLGWAALRLHGLEGEAYRRDALIAALEADARNVERLGKHWPSAAKFVAEVAERTGLLIPDTGRVRTRAPTASPTAPSASSWRRRRWSATWAPSRRGWRARGRAGPRVHRGQGPP
jgi:hypothetical protein